MSKHRDRSLALPDSGTAEEILAMLGATRLESSEQILEFADRAASVGQASPDAPVEEDLTLLLFELSGEVHAIALSRALEILRVGVITRVPGSPQHVRGITNLRGRILPVVELRTRLTLGALEVTPMSRIIVVEVSGRTLGILVDAVCDIVRTKKSAFSAPPSEVMNEVTDYVHAVGRLGDRLVLLMELERALRVPGTTTFPKTAAGEEAP